MPDDRAGVMPAARQVVTSRADARDTAFTSAIVMSVACSRVRLAFPKPKREIAKLLRDRSSHHSGCVRGVRDKTIEPDVASLQCRVGDKTVEPVLGFAGRGPDPIDPRSVPRRARRVRRRTWLRGLAEHAEPDRALARLLDLVHRLVGGGDGTFG